MHVCVTAQHCETLNQVLSLFSILADVDVDIVKPGQYRTDITASIILALPDALEEGGIRTPYLAWRYDNDDGLSIGDLLRAGPIGHVEAGLRTGNLYAPWPEGANRMIVGHLVGMHFAPTETARQAC